MEWQKHSHIFKRSILFFYCLTYLPFRAVNSWNNSVNISKEPFSPKEPHSESFLDLSVWYKVKRRIRQLKSAMRKNTVDLWCISSALGTTLELLFSNWRSYSGERNELQFDCEKSALNVRGEGIQQGKSSAGYYVSEDFMVWTLGDICS